MRSLKDGMSQATEHSVLALIRIRSGSRNF